MKQMKGANLSTDHGEQQFIAPVLVDWDNGKIAVNDVPLAESILKQLHESTKKDV